MPENEQNSDFMIEKIKERPINKRKLFRRTMMTAAMAAMFGLIACVTFLLLEPVINNWLYPEEEPAPAPVVFPEDLEEMEPEDMLAENIPPEGATNQTGGNSNLEQEQIQEILSEVVLDKDNYSQVYSALSQYVTELNHSMVTVTGVSSNVDWFNNVEESKNQASGVIIANNGQELLILVDYTPLRRAESMTMTFSYLDAATNAQPQYQVPVTLKEQDGSTNLAVLSADLMDIPVEMLEEGGVTIATLGSSNIRNLVGTPVIAMGSPMGSSGSVGYGIVTAITSQSQKVDSNYKLFQTDIYGSQNAGGVLFNLQGQVIGVITNQNTGTDMKNLVNAYGISELKKRIEKISNGKKAAYMGISAVDVTEEAHNELGVPYGAFIRDVDMNSPAMLAGIQQGDVLTAFGDRSILSYNDYITALMQKEPDDTVKITVIRAAQGEYKEMEIRIVLDVQ